MAIHGVKINNGLHVNAMAVNSKDEIFIGASYNGIYKSTDNGNSWTNINNGLANL